MTWLRTMWQRWAWDQVRPAAAIKSFEQELKVVGGLASRSDAGLQVVPVEQIVGSVGRWQNLRPDFCFRTGPPMTARHERIARAMTAGLTLPPLELYALTVLRSTGGQRVQTEYYVVDGHHRVAMAKRLGQDFLDAHIIEYRVVSTDTPRHSGAAVVPGREREMVPSSEGGELAWV